MTSKNDPIPEDVRLALELAVKALFAWDAIGGDEPTIVVHGSPTLISKRRHSRQNLQGYDACRFVLAHGPSRQSLAQTQTAGVEVEP